MIPIWSETSIGKGMQRRGWWNWRLIDLKFRPWKKAVKN